MQKLISYKEAATQAILQAMQMDERVFLMGEGVDNITGIYGHVLPAASQFPKRVIDTPLSENGLTGFAIGTALGGLRPILIHQRNDFMLLAMDQMMNQAAKFRYVSGGRHRIPLVVLSFVAKKPGEGIQHSQSLQSVFAHFPGIKVGMPATPSDAKGMLLLAIEDDDPVIILEHRSLFETTELVEQEYFTTPYQADLVVEGTDLTIVAVSVAVSDAIKAAEYFNLTSGPSCEVINLRWVRPLDIDLIVKSVEKTRRLLVVDTGWKAFGLSSEVMAQVCERVEGLKVLPKRLGMLDIPCPASHYLEKFYHPKTVDIVDAALRMF